HWARAEAYAYENVLIYLRLMTDSETQHDFDRAMCDAVYAGDVRSVSEMLEKCLRQRDIGLTAIL
ncbi:MAG: hypothetical protein ACRD1R_11080, partial [Acidobacteriota bacterium]